ncbi:MAG: hypothetical protein ABIG95_03275 [Candidatus Woesearchaeota archaeon]
MEKEQCFFTNDGKVLSNLQELHEALKGMDEGTFRHHVNPNKNDFANWIRDVICKKALANKVAKTNSMAEMQEVLVASLKTKGKGYFSQLEKAVMANKLPENLLQEMRDHWL